MPIGYIAYQSHYADDRAIRGTMGGKDAGLPHVPAPSGVLRHQKVANIHGLAG